MPQTDIIPVHPVFYDRISGIIGNSGSAGKIDLKAVCIFAACGFFLDEDTYFENTGVLPPATIYGLDLSGKISDAKKYWHWHYSPRDISLKQATEEFAHLFQRITSEQLKGKKVILPLSGGLDSRTQAVVLPKGAAVNAYSYEFANSFNETGYGARISVAKQFSFSRFVIPEGYLWNKIEELAGLNGCYSEFTHPRQMAVIDELSALGDLFYIGHWGDVLFDDMGVANELSFEELVNSTIKKVTKKGGKELANALWTAWGIEGTFDQYLKERIAALLQNIKIENANARIRAFKSLYWAPRWTSVNLSVFSSRHPLAIPYYDARMCEFICNIPEALLAGRQIQIEYLKMNAPELAGIPWQTYDPYNLYNYHRFGSIGNVPRRALKKAGRIVRERILERPPLTTRNWEIQFCGKENDLQLRKYLFENPEFKKLVPEALIKDFYNKFRESDPVWYSHPLSMLLTLSLFSKQQKKS